MTSAYIYQVQVVRVIDGDTFVGIVDLGFRVFHRVTFRIEEFDAPETHRPLNEAEREHGKAATAMAQELLGGNEVTVRSYKTGKYGRWGAKVTLPDGRDFTVAMREAGLEKRESYDE